MGKMCDRLLANKKISESECVIMEDTKSAENNRSRLQTAKKNVKTEQGNAKDVQKDAKKNFTKDITLWKGKHFEAFKKDWDTLNGNYNYWIRRSGWGDDGSINGVIDKMDHEIGTITAWLDSLFN